MIHRFSILMLLITCVCHATYAQADAGAVKAIQQYIQYIDSVSEGRPADFSTSIADGIIETDDHTTGGFGIYTLSNIHRDTAFRIVYNGSLDIGILKTYYFKDNKLVYAKLAFTDSHTGSQLFYQREEYYHHNGLVWTKTEGGKDAEKYASRAAFSLFKDGSGYLADFKQERR